MAFAPSTRSPRDQEGGPAYLALPLTLARVWATSSTQGLVHDEAVGVDGPRVPPRAEAPPSGARAVAAMPESMPPPG